MHCPLNIWTISFVAFVIYTLVKVVQLEFFESPKEIEKHVNKKYNISQLSCATAAALNELKKVRNNDRLVIIKMDNLRVNHKVFSFGLMVYDFKNHVTDSWTFKVNKPLVEKNAYVVASYTKVKVMSDTDKTMLPSTSGLTDAASYYNVQDLRK